MFPLVGEWRLYRQSQLRVILRHNQESPEKEISADHPCDRSHNRGVSGQYVGFMRNNAYSRSQGSLLPAGDLDNIQVMVIRSERDAVTLIHVDCNQTARC
jgi:hypothetical protein